MGGGCAKTLRLVPLSHIRTPGATRKCMTERARRLAPVVPVPTVNVVHEEGQVSRHEQLHERLSTPPTNEYLDQRAAEGWKLAGVIWEREAETAAPVDIPYGLRVAGDCTHLVEDERERETLLLMLELVVQDKHLGDVAHELNRRGFRTRSGAEWGPAGVFDMLPRLIDAGAEVFPSGDWAERRKHFAAPA